MKERQKKLGQTIFELQKILYLISLCGCLSPTLFVLPYRFYICVFLCVLLGLAEESFPSGRGDPEGALLLLFS